MKQKKKLEKKCNHQQKAEFEVKRKEKLKEFQIKMEKKIIRIKYIYPIKTIRSNVRSSKKLEYHANWQ